MNIVIGHCNKNEKDKYILIGFNIECLQKWQDLSMLLGFILSKAVAMNWWSMMGGYGNNEETAPSEGQQVTLGLTLYSSW